MRFFTSIHLILLLYIIAAIVFWEFDLQKQSTQIYEKDVIILKKEVDSTLNPTIYNERYAGLYSKHKARRQQFIGEGATFLIFILIGAVVVYSSFSRRIRLSRQQNNFMLAVTHELKSPIAAMKLNLQTMERHQLSDDKKKLLIDRCIKESNRLNDLCNNMLFASQIEGGQFKPARERFDLSELVEDTVRDYANRYSRKFEQDIEPEFKLTGDKVMIQMVISNLLENAVKYTPENLPINIILTTGEKYVTIQIIDLGCGIPDNEKKKVFNKFYRVGNEESRKSKGTGLGLYLTNKIVQQHKGRITVKDNSPNGSIFEITIPV